MKITDKQRIDFVQWHRLCVYCDHHTGTFNVYEWRVMKSTSPRNTIPDLYMCHIQSGKTVAEAVDKAIKAYMGGKK